MFAKSLEVFTMTMCTLWAAADDSRSQFAPDSEYPNSLGALETLQSIGTSPSDGAAEPVEAEPLAKCDDGPESEVTRATVFPVLKLRKDDDSEKVKFLDLWIAEGYSYEREGDHSKSAMLDVPFASLVKREEHGDDHKEVSVLNLPFTTLVEAEEHGDASSLKLVDIPLFTLLDNEDHGDGTFDNRFIKLPIIGSLFRHQRTDEKEKVRFLIFSHTRRFDKDDPQEQQRRETREEKYKKARESRY